MQGMRWRVTYASGHSVTHCAGEGGGGGGHGGGVAGGGGERRPGILRVVVSKRPPDSWVRECALCKGCGGEILKPVITA